MIAPKDSASPSVKKAAFNAVHQRKVNVTNALIIGS